MSKPDKTAAGPYGSLIEDGTVTPARFAEARVAALARDVELERVLTEELEVPRQRVLESLARHYGLPAIEYDERMPVPPDLLSPVDGERLSLSQWFPLVREGNTVVVGANRPNDPTMRAEVRHYFPDLEHEFRVALAEDVQRFIEDFLNHPPGRIIGTERTGLAFWRNTMAQWRTRLSCYLTDLSDARTRLALLRWGLGIIALGTTVLRSQSSGPMSSLSVILVPLGILLVLFGLIGYLRIRRSILKPSHHHTLVEVTGATLHFLQSHHVLEDTGIRTPTRTTMLGRLSALIAEHCTILYPVPSSRVRTQLARERNVLAAQRTVAACHRTVYARARTGLAFIRTGVSFASLGFGLITIFGLSPSTILDGMLVAAGVLMAADGVRWYVPVSREASDLPRCGKPVAT